MNELDLDLADKEIASAFAGNKVGDECSLDNVQLRVKRLNMSHDDEYDDKTGKPTGKKKVRGSITFEVKGFDYGDESYEFSNAKEKDGAVKTAAPAQPKEPSASGKSKSGLVVAIGLGKPKGKY